MTNKTELLQKKLNEDIKRLENSLESFQKSYGICKSIGVKGKYSFEEQESFDSLTSKFSRISDIYIQKILKTVLMIEREDWNTIIDMINLSEKLELINSAEELIMIRDLRNSIVHEYAEEIISQIYIDTLEMSEKLSGNVKKTIEKVSLRF